MEDGVEASVRVGGRIENNRRMSSSSKAGLTTTLPPVVTSGASQACDNSRNECASGSSLPVTAESALKFDVTSASIQHNFKQLKDEVASLCKHLEAFAQKSKRSSAKNMYNMGLAYHRELSEGKGIRLDEECPLVIIGYSCLSELKELLSLGKTAQRSLAILKNIGARTVEDDEYICLREELLTLSSEKLKYLAELSRKDEVALQLTISLWRSCGAFCLYDSLFQTFVQQYTLRTYNLDLNSLATHLQSVEGVNMKNVSSLAEYLAEIELMFRNIHVAIKPLEIRKLDICLQYLHMISHDPDVRDGDKSNAMLAACIRAVLTTFDKAELRLGMLGAQDLPNQTLLIEIPNDQVEKNKPGALPALELSKSSSCLGRLCSPKS